MPDVISQGGTLELLTEEYMHGFGGIVDGIRTHLYLAAAALGKFELMPSGKDGNLTRQWHRDEMEKYPPKPKEVLNHFRWVAFGYKMLEKIVAEQDGERLEHSYLFLRTKSLVKKLQEVREGLLEYLDALDEPERWKEAFSPYEDYLKMAFHGQDCLRTFRKLYGMSVDINMATANWLKKHPEFKRGEYWLKREVLAHIERTTNEVSIRLR
ncbi:hypothetical protein HYU13_03535 [Candidatus Woesearchaeota archaeon]|nr:hypothetical protein [Candidatus Woesearchaeota archaeon]